MRQQHVDGRSGMVFQTQRSNVSMSSTISFDDDEGRRVRESPSTISLPQLDESMALDDSTNITSTTNETPIISNCSKGIENSSLCPSLDDTISSATTVPINNLSNPSSNRLKSPQYGHAGMEDLLLTYQEKSMRDNSSFQLDMEIGSVVFLFITGFFLSIYSSLSCNFVKCYIGFMPSNINIQEVYINIGIWSFEKISSMDDSISKRCLLYPNDFSKAFIQGYTTWSISRVLGIMNIILGWCTIIIMSLGLSRLEVFSWAQNYWLFWTFATSFILVLSEAINLFVFRKVPPCTSTDIWADPGGNTRSAERCSFSLGAYCAVAALIMYFIALLLMFRRHSRGSLKRTNYRNTYRDVDSMNDPVAIGMQRRSSVVERSYSKKKSY